MRLLLIEAIDYGLKEVTSFPSLGLGCIAAYLKKYLASVEIKIISKNIESNLTAFKPDLVGISSVSQNFNAAKEAARLCKAKGLFVIMGGFHISSLPNNLDQSMDLGVIGEGEQTMLEILKLGQDFGFNHDRIRQLTG
ncbi:cobalamin-dependent protein, partial [Candidatus Omnitrophota bacterium]